MTATWIRLGAARLIDDLRRCRSAPTRLRPWQRRLLAVILLIVVPPLMTAPFAAADDGVSNPWLAFYGPTDSHGLAPWNYELNLDGGNITNPLKPAALLLASIGWMIYRFWVVAVCWLLDFVLQFRQFELLRGPARAAAQVIENVVDRVGIVPSLTTLSILMSGFLLFRSRYGAAIGEMVTSVAIAALVGTSLAHPMGWVASDDGALARARDTGANLTSELLLGGMGMAGSDVVTAADARKLVQQRVLDTLVRTPHQLINYGQVLDKTGTAACVSTYDSTLRTPPTGQEARVPIAGACGKQAEAAANDPMMALLGVLVVTPSASFFFLLVFVLAIVLFVLTMLVLWEAAKFIVALIRAILPGSNRAAMFECLLTIIVGVFFITLALTSMAILLLVLDGVFSATSDWHPVVIFILVDILLLSATIAIGLLAVRAKKHGRKLGHSTAAALTRRPGSLPHGPGLLGAAREVALPLLQMRQHAQMRAALSGGASPGGTPNSGRAAGVTKTVTKGVIGAAKIGLASTVGAPAYAPRAAAAAKTALMARKANLVGRLHTAGAQAAAFGREYGANLLDGGRVGMHLGAAAAQVVAGNPAGAAPSLAAAWTGASAVVDRAGTRSRPSSPPPAAPSTHPAPAPASPPTPPSQPRIRPASTGPRPGAPVAGTRRRPDPAPTSARRSAPTTGPASRAADLRARLNDHKPKTPPSATPTTGHRPRSGR